MMSEHLESFLSYLEQPPPESPQRPGCSAFRVYFNK